MPGDLEKGLSFHSFKRLGEYTSQASHGSYKVKDFGQYIGLTAGHSHVRMEPRTLIRSPSALKLDVDYLSANRGDLKSTVTIHTVL